MNIIVREEEEGGGGSYNQIELTARSFPLD